MSAAAEMNIKQFAGVVDDKSNSGFFSLFTKQAQEAFFRFAIADSDNLERVITIFYAMFSGWQYVDIFDVQGFITKSKQGDV